MRHIGLFELVVFCALQTIVAWCLERFASLPIWASVPLAFAITLFLPFTIFLVVIGYERFCDWRRRRRLAR